LEVDPESPVTTTTVSTVHCVCAPLCTVADGRWHYGCVDLFSQARDSLSAEGTRISRENNVTAIAWQAPRDAGLDSVEALDTGVFYIDEMSVSTLVRAHTLHGVADPDLRQVAANALPVVELKLLSSQQTVRGAGL
jgi:hypothetical protein